MAKIIIQLDSALQEALDLLKSWKESGENPSPEELARIDPQAAQVMRSHIFQDGKLQGRERIDNLVELVFEISETITLDTVRKDPEKWRELVEQEFEAHDKAFNRAANIYLICHGYSFARMQPKRPLEQVKKLKLTFHQMQADAVAKLASLPQFKGDLADSVSGILKRHCPEATSYTIACSTKELLEELEILHIESETVRKRLDRKAESKAP